MATDMLSDATPLLVLVIAIAVGVIGALLATWLQRAAVFLAGLVAGGVLVVTVMRGLGVVARPTLTVGFIAGALPGGILSVALFEWALIFLSATVGAVLVTQVLPLWRAAALPVLLVLIVAGVLVQARSLREEQQ